MFHRFFLPRLLTAVLFVGLVSCDDDSTGPGGNSLANVVVGVTTADQTATATFQAGAPPAEGSGPLVQVAAVSSLIPGGTGLVRISTTLAAPLSEASESGKGAPSGPDLLRSTTASSAFTQVVIASPDWSGYYLLALQASADEVVLAVTLSAEADVGTLTLMAAAGAAGSVGQYDQEDVPVQQAGTGEVQVSVSWDAPSDVDLHVVTPSGAEIYYGNPTADGGELDIDSNAGCVIDGVNQENVTFADAPSGEYIVRVDYWDSCGVEETNYVVTVRVEGQETRTFSGTFTGPGTGGGEGDGVEIVRFTF